MGIESAFLRQLPGFLFAVAGLVAQFYLGKLLSVRRSFLWVLAYVELLIYVVSLEVFSKLMYRFLPWIGNLAGAELLWWWALTPLAVILWLKNWLLARKQTVPSAAASFDPSFDPARRRVLSLSAAAIGIAPAATLACGIIIRKNLVINEINLKFPDLPKDLQGLRLVQLSDMHLGSYYSPADLQYAVDAANSLRADIALVTGDLITNEYDPLDRCLLELKRLRSTAGIWGCMGNHEMHSKVEAYTASKGRENGIQFLRQQSAPLKFGQSVLNLSGVDHQRRDRTYLKDAEQLVVPSAFNILLSHNPDVFPVAAKQGFNLTLSGHTHGGQINLPIAGNDINVVDLVTPFTKGSYQIEHSRLYVNCGLGTIGVPVRLGAPPEVTLIRLCNS